MTTAGSLVMLLTLVVGGVRPAAAQDAERALAIAREVERIAHERTLWPGFDPLSIPLAVYTGGHTYLFRHPAPPEGFTPLPGATPAATVLDGRHPAVTSNSSADIGGTMTATLLADGARAALDPTELAASALHEAFHVYQRTRHPGWVGNEGDLLLYPVADARLLGLRRRESAALRHALTATEPASVCWTRIALAARRERFAAMDSAFSAYERLTELNEGLATYLQLVAAGRATVEIPAEEFPPAGVRDRIYTVGPALAFLLDRLRPGWRAALEADDAQYLDSLLSAALAGQGRVAARCAFTAAELGEIERTAREDAASVVVRRTERRRAFDARDGWRVVVEAAAGRPLWPQSFDPLNIERVDGGLLHARFVQLGNDAGELRAIDEDGADIEALTEAAGAHPLFNGIARVTIAGLPEPEVNDDGSRIALHGPGIEAQFTDASVEVRGREVVIRLRQPHNEMPVPTRANGVVPWGARWSCASPPQAELRARTCHTRE